LPETIEKIRWVTGPNKRGSNSWQVSYVRVDGKKKSRTFKFKEVAEQCANQLRSQIVTEPEIKAEEFRPYDGTLKWYSDFLAYICIETYKTRDEFLVKYLKSVASAALSAKHIKDNSELESEVETLREKVKEILGARKYGSGNSRFGEGVKQAPQLDSTIC
jgi:hypothetical protein